MSQPGSLSAGKATSTARGPAGGWWVLALTHLIVPSAWATEYAGQQTCLSCHEDVVHAYSGTVHAKLFQEKKALTPLQAQGCEACHGPGATHAAGEIPGDIITFRGTTPEEIAREEGACLACHAKGARMYWKGSPHEGRDLGCTSCHRLMRPASERGLLAASTEVETCGRCHQDRRAEVFRNAHMPLREGKMSCTSCHNPHGSQTPSLLVANTVNEVCYRCHAEKRGPFLWEHAPVAESCTNCHDAHGSVRDWMLTLSPPRLCQQCHIETLHPTEARLPASRFVIGRACLQCHQMIHGSNHPSGFDFTR